MLPFRSATTITFEEETLFPKNGATISIEIGPGFSLNLILKSIFFELIPLP